MLVYNKFIILLYELPLFLLPSGFIEIYNPPSSKHHLPYASPD